MGPADLGLVLRAGVVTAVLAAWMVLVRMAGFAEAGLRKVGC